MTEQDKSVYLMLGTDDDKKTSQCRMRRGKQRNLRNESCGRKLWSRFQRGGYGTAV